MRANKTDTNQARIVTELRNGGYKVRSIAEIKNACDLLVYNGKRLELFEVKNPEYCRNIEYMDQEGRRQFLTDGEAKFAENFKVWIVISAEEVVKVFKNKLQ